MAEKKRSSFILLLEHIHTMEELTDEEFGQFVRAYAAYVETGADPEFSDRSMRMMWKTVKAFDKMNTQKYSSTSEARSEAGKRGMKSRWGAKSEDSKEKKVITNDNKNSKCYFVNNKNNLSVSDPVSDSVSDSVSVIPPIGGIERDVPAAVDMELSKIVQHYQQTIGDFPRSALDKLQKWRQEYSTEMILLAIDKAAEAGKRSWNYINGILSGWQRDGIQTPVDVLANEQSRQARPRGKQPTETVDDQLARVLAKMDRERGFET
ncbi:DnaD domain protein [Faecalibacterium prausnitzii]